ncbi:MAG TPA: hypothetical protein VF312_03565, partial [Propionibacteriaceae bacterium]
RNLNLGQARSHSPTSSQLLDAFVEAGARAPSHVGTNGTVVYYHPTGPTLVRRVAKLLTPMCGYRDMVTVRSGAALIVISVNHRRAITQHRPGSHPTGANPFIASLVGVPTMTRSITTMRRVADRVRECAGA